MRLHFFDFNSYHPADTNNRVNRVASIGALELVRSKEQPDGTWLLERVWKGATPFPVDDGVGKPSRWNTLRALRVLRWADGSTG